MIERGLFFYIGDGDNWCHPSYIDDVVRGMALALERGRSSEIYHITGERPQRWRAFAEAIASRWMSNHRVSTCHARSCWLVLAGEGWASLSAKPPLSRTGVDFFSENRGTSCVKARVELDIRLKSTLLPAYVGRLHGIASVVCCSLFLDTLQ